MIEPLDPAHLPGKRRSDDGYLSGPFLIRAIGRDWKSGSIEIHLENHIVVTLPAWPGFGADDVRQAFDSRWSLDGNIREDPQSGTWHMAHGTSKREPNSCQPLARKTSLTRRGDGTS